MKVTLESDSSSDPASSNPGTPHSPNQSLPTLTGSSMGVRVIEARLQGNVARNGKLNPFVRIVYDQQVWTTAVSTRQGNKPKWNAFHIFDRTDAEVVALDVMHKARMSGDTEIGHCSMHLTDVMQGHQTEWWSLLLGSGEVAGTILLTFEFPQEESIRLTTHSSQSSLDMKEELSKQLESFKEREAVQFPAQDFHFEKSRPKSGLPETPFEASRRQLLEENQVLRAKEQELKRHFEYAKAEDLKHKKAKAEMAKFKETLKRREATLALEEAKLKAEQEDIERERKKLDGMRGQLNHDSAKLKQERTKLQMQRTEIEQAYTEVGKTSVKISKEIATLKKQSGGVSRPRDSAEELREQAQLQQVRETLADKQRILMGHLEQIRSDREQVKSEREQIKKEKEELEGADKSTNLEEQWGLLSEKIDREVLSPVNKLMRYPSNR